MDNSKIGTLEIRNYKPLGEVVFEYLRESILNGTLKPGERLMEIALAEQMGVSRTPVREAIRKLEKESFVEMIPRKGAYVADLTAKDIIDVLEIRILLEGFASSLAAQRMSEDELAGLRDTLEAFNDAVKREDRQAMIDQDNMFHNKIFEATKNNKLIEIVKDLHDQFQRFRLTYFTEFDNYPEIQLWHQRIYDAILSNDNQEAKNAAEQHVQVIMEAVMRWKEKRNE
jgi:DNA-binding GntR family transcriptional regulator